MSQNTKIAQHQTEIKDGTADRIDVHCLLLFICVFLLLALLVFLVWVFETRCMHLWLLKVVRFFSLSLCLSSFSIETKTHCQSHTDIFASFFIIISSFRGYFHSFRLFCYIDGTVNALHESFSLLFAAHRSISYARRTVD